MPARPPGCCDRRDGQGAAQPSRPTSLRWSLRSDRPAVGHRALKVVGEFVGRGIALVLLLLQALEADRLKVAWDARVQQTRGHGVLLAQLKKHVLNCLGLERRASREQVIKDRADAVHVTPRTGSFFG